MNGKERDMHEISCPRCGADAQWSFIDEQKSQVEVMCEECGRFEMTREEFDQAALEHVELTQPERV